MIRGSDCTKLSGVLYQAVTPHTAGRALEDASLAADLAAVPAPASLRAGDRVRRRRRRPRVRGWGDRRANTGQPSPGH